MTTKIAVLLAEGFEEIEAITVVDVLRRAELDVTTVAVGEATAVRGAHGLTLEADSRLDDKLEVDALVLPGGSAGARRLRDDERVQELIKRHAALRKKTLAAICAAPIALAKAGVLRDHHVTCYPGFEDEVKRGGAHLREGEQVVIDGNVVTSRGPGTAMAFALALVERFVNPERAKELSRSMLVTGLT